MAREAFCIRCSSLLAIVEYRCTCRVMVKTHPCGKGGYTNEMQDIIISMMFEVFIGYSLSKRHTLYSKDKVWADSRRIGEVS